MCVALFQSRALRLIFLFSFVSEYWRNDAKDIKEDET